MIFQDFKDKRNREWEWFIDQAYFDMTCVRLKGQKDFNSEMSFHFDTSKKATEFVELLKVSS